MMASASPDARRAHLIARKAIKDGKLIRKPCEVCGARPVDAHHNDYDRPLDVRWLCQKHHRRFHCLVPRRKLAQEAGWGEDFLSNQESADLIGVSVYRLYELHNQLETVRAYKGQRIYRDSSVRKLVNHFARVNALLASV